MKTEQYPICHSNLEVKNFAPCDDCGVLEKEIITSKMEFINTLFMKFMVGLNCNYVIFVM